MKLEQARAAIAQGDHRYKATFATPDGQAVLADLEARFMDRSSIVPGDPYATHAREGAREVVLYIQKRMRGARDVLDE
jgi:hypothetical protein